MSLSGGRGSLPTSSYSPGSSFAQARLGVGGVDIFSFLRAEDLRLSPELILVKAEEDLVLGCEEKMDLLVTRGEDGREAGSESRRARDGRAMVEAGGGACQGWLM